MLMRPAGLIPLSFILLLVRDAGAQYLAFEPLGATIPATQSLVLDLNGDGSDELVTCAENHVYVYTWDGERFAMRWQLSQDRGWTTGFGGTGDLTGDGLPEFCVLLIHPDTLRLRIHGFRGNRSS